MTGEIQGSSGLAGRDGLPRQLNIERAHGGEGSVWLGRAQPIGRRAGSVLSPRRWCHRGDSGPFWRSRPAATAPRDAFLGPSRSYLFGSDDLGRDLFSRTVYGARVSLAPRWSSLVAAASIGVPIGLIAGYREGFVDALLMRVIDVVLAFPAILLAMGLIAVIGEGWINGALAVTIVSIPAFARLTRASVLREAAGVRHRRADDRRRHTPDLVPHGPAKLPRPVPCAGGVRRDLGDSARGGALIPRSRRQTADALLGTDVERGQDLSLSRLVVWLLPGPGADAGRPLTQYPRRNHAAHHPPRLAQLIAGKNEDTGGACWSGYGSVLSERGIWGGCTRGLSVRIPLPSW